MEIWKDVVGYEAYYQVSNFGNIRSVDRVIYSDKLHIGTKKRIKGQNVKTLCKFSWLFSFDIN